MPIRTDNVGKTIIETNGRSTTKTHLSPTIHIMVGGVAIAAIQKISINESRSIDTIKEVGTDGIIDSCPKSAPEISGDISRIRFGGKRIAEAFLRDFIHVKSQRIPFDITIVDNFVGDDDENKIITVIKNVWIKSIGYAYNSDNYTIDESMSYIAEDIFSYRGNGSNVVLPSNELLQYSYGNGLNEFERTADKGDFRGALDAPGLMNAFDIGGSNF